MKHNVADLAEKLGCRFIGNSSAEITELSSLHAAGRQSLVFVEDAERLQTALNSPAAAIIAGEFAGEFFSNSSSGQKSVLISKQPRLTFARAARLFQERNDSAAIHFSSVVSASAKIGENVNIMAGAVIGERVSIGEGCWIGAHSVIGDDVDLGSDCRIDANVTIYPSTKLGERVVVQSGAALGSAGFGYVRDSETGRYEQSPQIGRLVIEDDVEIGANTTIDRGALDETRIRRGAKIDNLVHIGHNVQIGENVVIAAQTGISGSVTIEDNVVMGGQVGIGDHARIEAGAMLGGQCGILPKKVLRGNGVVFWGTPAKPVREYLKELAFLARAAKKGR